MKKTLTMLAIAATLFSFSTASAQCDKKEGCCAKAKKGEVIKLFNGENLDGWYTYITDRGRDTDPKGVFTIKDGLLYISGEEWGCITTKEEYANYKITLRYKWGEKTYGSRAKLTRDSGLLFHSQGEDGKIAKAWQYSLETNIIEGGTGDFIVMGDGSEDYQMTVTIDADEQAKSGERYYKHGGKAVASSTGRFNWVNRDANWKDVLGFRGENDVENALGEWNVMECVIVGDEVYVFLNGQFINHATNIRPTKGRIQIQSEGAEIVFSDIEIKML